MDKNFESRQYCISTTASHYDWAIKKLKEQIKALSRDTRTLKK